ncbi:anaerobic ribonucleoside-triphosphate reductase activating protein [Candidatus Pacearchaeota archaeon]|nr:anaerobic ribonucleoside-triphosphate reductase activating protein [Candidatus Pacearchaeota archaeon]
MDIAVIYHQSLKDYPGKVSEVVFTPNCNYKCPACHAKEILDSKEKIDEKEFFNYLDSGKKWIDGVVLCGGEPTLEKDLIDFTEKLKKRDLAVKLDTNGSNPKVLEKLLDEKLIDYVAMDVKGPKSLYSKIIGKEKANVKDIEDSMKIVQDFPNYEFRTTIAPVPNGNWTYFMNVKDVVDMAKWIVNVTGGNKHKHYLQKFVPRENGLLDSRLEKFPETPEKLLKEIKKEIIKYLPNCEIRDED